jgi:outer membrane protein assembly factor BamB
MNIRAFLSILAIVAALPRVSGGQTPTGAMLWAYDVGPGVTIKSSPAVSPEGTVYFAANGILYAITNGGSNKWTFTIGGAAFSSPAIATDGTIYVASDAQGKLYAVNPDGSQKWTYDAQGANGSPAIGSDNTVYIHGGGYLHAVSQAGTLK